MDGRYMVKQYLGTVSSSEGSKFRVFTTQDSKVLLFCQLNESGCDTSFHIPVLRSNLTQRARWQLGMGKRPGRSSSPDKGE